MDDGVIIRQITRYESLVFESIWRVLSTHFVISMTIGCIGVVMDSSQVFEYLMLNIIGLPVFLFIAIHFLRSYNIDEQLALWTFRFRRSKNLTEDLTGIITKLVQKERNINHLKRIFGTFIRANPSLTESFGRSFRKLEDLDMIPSDLSELLDSLLP